MKMRDCVGLILAAGLLAFSPDLSRARGSRNGDDGVGGSVGTLPEGPAQSQGPNTHLLEEIELRVFRYLWEKVDLKLPPSPKCNTGWCLENKPSDLSGPKLVQ